MSINPKECPFCGGGHIGMASQGPTFKKNYWCECGTCYARGSVGKDWTEATERWNTRAGQEWQPIETAPKDDTIVLGFAAYEDGCYVVAACVFKHGGWVIVGFLNGDDVPIDLTHWMPLPKPPKEGSEEW